MNSFDIFFFILFFTPLIFYSIPCQFVGQSGFSRSPAAQRAASPARGEFPAALRCPLVHVGRRRESREIGGFDENVNGGN